MKPESGEHLRGQWSAIGERFSLDEFFRRVGLREGVDVPAAVFHARAVIVCLKLGVQDTCPRLNEENKA